jgi:hypothetical protein
MRRRYRARSRPGADPGNTTGVTAPAVGEPEDNHDQQETPMLSGPPRTFIGSTIFTVRGLADDDGATILVDSVAVVPGVDSVVVDLTSGAVTVRVSRLVDRADIATAIREAGFVLVS